MLVSLALAVVAGHPTHADDVLLEDFTSPRDRYQHTLGGEFPGAKATFEWTADGHDSPGALRIEFDFTDGGRYVQWHYAGWVAGEAESIAFSAKGPVGANVILRAVDDTGQYHQFGASLDSDEWQHVAIPLDPAKSTGHWGGANDGTIHQPFKSLFIGPTAGDVMQGALLLDRLAVATTLSPEEVAMSRIDHFLAAARVEVEANEPSLLFRAYDTITIDLAVPDVPVGIDEVRLTLRTTDAYGRPVEGFAESLALTRKDSFTAPYVRRRLPGPGYYETAYSIVIGERAGASGRFSCAYLGGRVGGGKNPESPFGVNTHFNQGWSPAIGAIVKRAGIAWIRDGEANLEDRAIPVARANNLCYMPCFTWYRKPLDEHRKPEGSYDFADVAEWHGEYATKYGAEIDAYDLVNEPHGQWSEVLGGDWSGGPWQEQFAVYGKQVTDAIHEADPGATVLWEDIDQLLWYRRFFELGAGSVADVISPHPYNMHRNLPLPEDHAIITQMAEFRRFAEERDLSWEVWSGEVGFGTFELTDETGTGFYTPHSELAQANMLVRMMVLQLSAGVERIFWYDFFDDGAEPHNPEHNFGL
ncbi:MAG TPA: hypothetical protein QGH10_04860, partial [Armatimonadota bacterium]|nr:hypothetical protein [Armatimonadota bacterium]